jgi:RNA polymerase sigma factor (sigma-70 family)
MTRQWEAAAASGSCDTVCIDPDQILARPTRATSYITPLMQAMTCSDDDLLLTQAAAAGSREALAAIARQYAGFVYHAALRQVRDPHLAEDVTQAVFVILQDKVRTLRPGTVLHAWLFTTTRYAANNALKMRARRIHHERVAATMRPEKVEAGNAAPLEPDVAPLLDAALAQLRADDRSAVLLSFFAKKSWRDVGTAIGVSEEAARKRVERAIVRLRRFFVKRGVEVTGAAIVATMSTSADAAAPAALVETIAGNLMSAPATAGTVGALAKGVMHMMTWAKIKLTCAVTALALSIVCATGAAMLRHGGAGDDKTVPPPADAVAELANETKVELLGVCKRPSAGEAWWNADGSPAAAPYTGSDGSNNNITIDPPAQREVVFRITGAGIDDMGIRIELPDQRGWTTGQIDGAQDCRVISFNSMGKDTADLRITLATGPWETMLSQQATGFRSDKHIVFGPAIEEENGCVVTTSDDLMDHEARVVAVGADGKIHQTNSHYSGITKGFRQMTTRFDMPKAEIDHFEFQARPFDQFVMYRNVSLEPGKNGGFKKESGTVEPKPAEK